MNNSTSIKIFSPDVNAKIKSALTTHVYQATRLSQLATLICATVVICALFKMHENNRLVISWFIIFCFIVFLRHLLVITYLHQTNTDSRLNLWRGLYSLGAFCGGICWGFAGTVLSASATNSQQMLIILVIAGVTSGSAPLLCAQLSAFMLFIGAALLPTIIHLLFFEHANQAFELFGITVLAYLFYLALLAFKLHAMLVEAFTLKFENDLLLTHLSETKSQLEDINKKLAHAATHDPLTRLPNRNLFINNLSEAMGHAKMNNEIVALLYIDLDHFKEINDAYGHHIGDMLLLEVVNRLRETIKNQEAISRLGGDELTIILENINDPDKVNHIANQLCHSLANPIVIQNHKIVGTASIGIGIYPIDGEDIETLIRNADKAMYYVKEHGGNNIRFSTESAIIKRLINIAKGPTSTM